MEAPELLLKFLKKVNNRLQNDVWKVKGLMLFTENWKKKKRIEMDSLWKMGY